MWHDSKPKKAFFQRWWFRTLLVLFVIGAVAAGAGFIWIQGEFGAKADELDLNKLSDMESASIVYDRQGRILGKIYIQNRDTITLGEMPGALVPALLAAEDNRFFEHNGVDIVGIARAGLMGAMQGRFRQGASTITQQLARNTYPEALPPSDRTWRRKVLEMFVARRIERHFSKSQILEFYLNRVYFGAGFYGIEAAAHGYFGKSARELTLSECATLTGMLRSPNNRSPWSNRQASIAIRNVVLERMEDNGSITKEQYEAAINENLAVKNRKPIYAESHAVEFVRQQVSELVGSNESIYGDGYRVYTTIDLDLQRTAERSLESRLEEVEQRPEFGKERETYASYNRLFRNRQSRADGEPLPGPRYLQGALVAMENRTGGILALVGGRNFRHNQFNRAMRAHRPAGTAFLPLVYAAAYESGIFPGTVYQDAVIDNRQVMIGGTTGVLGEWGVEKADNRYEGPIPAHDALVKSKNAASVRLGMSVGVDEFLKFAKNAGIDSELRPYPATFLGSSETTLEDLTLSYTQFPNGGTRPARAFIITKVTEKDGKVIYEHPNYKPIRVTSEATAYQVHTALADALEWGSADKAYPRYHLKKVPAGGKTGTAYNFTDVWFVGYSSEITCGVWAGFDSPQSIYRGGFSSDIALPIWVDFMNASFKPFPSKPLPQPSTLQKIEVCRSSGLLATPDCVEKVKLENGEELERSTTTTYFATEAQRPQQVCDVHGEIGGHGIRVQRGDRKKSNSGPRAVLAVDLDRFLPVAMKAPNILGQDPFGSIRTASVRRAVPADPNAAVDLNLPPAPDATAESESDAIPAPAIEDGSGSTPQIRRAIPVRALDGPEDPSMLKLEAPPAIQF